MSAANPVPVTASPGTIYIASPGTIYISVTGTGTGATWQNWNQAWTSTGTIAGATYSTGGWIQWNTAYVQEAETAEEERARLECERTAAENWERCWREQEEAGRRAGELLVSFLSDEQAESWRADQHFTVRGSRTGTRYRIRHGTFNNVDRLDGDGRPDANMCAHPPGVPAEDANLAQMLLLVTDEDAFLAVANIHPLRQPQLEAVA